MIDKLVEARRFLENSVDFSTNLGFSALRASVEKILEYLEEAEGSTALQVREKALAQAERIFQEATAQVLKVYDEAIAQAWEVYEEASG